MNERRVGGRAVARVEKPEPETAAQASRGRIQTTMGEYGEQLPVGILDERGVLHKALATKPWRTKDELELSRKIPTDASMPEHVAMVVANMCTRIGPYDMGTLDDATRKLRVDMMYMADVFYAYTWLRRRVMGKKLALEVECARRGCDVKFPYAGDLDSLDVFVVENIDDILWTYTLEIPIEIRGVTVTKFNMAYPRWEIMNRARGDVPQAEVELYSILGSIVGLNDQSTPVALTESELGELSRPDFELLTQGIDAHYLGPKMGIEGECTPAVCERFKRGGFKFKYPIDFRYKSFFGASSR